MSNKLTDQTIPALDEGQHADPDCPGLVIRVSPHSRRWSLRYRLGGKPGRVSLGDFPTVKAPAARKLARTLRAAALRGEDPKAVLGKPTQDEEAPVTFADMVGRWKTDRAKKGRRSVDETHRILKLHVLPRLGDKALEDFTGREVAKLLEDLRDKKGLTAQCNRVQTAIVQVFNFAVAKREIAANPVAGLERVVEEAPRERTLSLEEMVRVWKAAESMDSIAGDICQLLLLVPFRREEASQLAWPEIGPDAIELPASRMKAKRPHKVPLTNAAKAVIERYPRGSDGHFVFSANKGASSFHGWVRAARTLRARAGIEEHWTVHDIRRSVLTGMASIGVEEWVLQELAHHSRRGRLGITSVYLQAFDPTDKMREALEAWEAHLMDAVGTLVDARLTQRRQAL